ncbi:MAG TPA: GGDEF domain-containing protein [Acidimicrobiales bacterium]|nr:GGDEF domain-containing protein [Acidimicrobiales bacterium]
MPDQMTGALTRDELNATFDQLAQRGGLLACISVDLDGFKSFNGAVGQLRGDTALREVAERVGGVVGSDGVVARVSGGTLVVLSDRWDLDAAESVAEQIAHAVLKLPVLRANEPHELSESECSDAKGHVFFFGPDDAGDYAIAPVRGIAPGLPKVDPTAGLSVTTAFISVSTGVSVMPASETTLPILVRAAEDKVVEAKRRLPDWGELLRLRQER